MVRISPFWRFSLLSCVLYSVQKPNEFWNIFFIPVKNVCGFASLVTPYCRVWNEPKKLLYHLIVQYLNLFMFNGFMKILKIERVQSSLRSPMNLGEFSTFFVNFHFVRQNNCQFGWDENIENIATYFSLFSVVKLIFVKI